MSGKKAKEERKAQTEEVKKYGLTPGDLLEFKRILTTMGFFNAAVEGLQLSLQVKQSEIELRHNVVKAPEGYVLKSKIDLESGFLMVRKVKADAEQSEEAAQKTE